MKIKKFISDHKDQIAIVICETAMCVGGAIIGGAIAARICRRDTITNTLLLVADEAGKVEGGAEILEQVFKNVSKTM